MTPLKWPNLSPKDNFPAMGTVKENYQAPSHGAGIHRFLDTGVKAGALSHQWGCGIPRGTLGALEDSKALLGAIVLVLGGETVLPQRRTRGVTPALEQ